MRTRIINYAKTRDTYVAYRKAGYSKKFLSEHESDITLHKAAKHYYVFMVAGAAKFLRIYYARVKEALLAQETEDTSAA